jgi:hypothetical protein
MQYYRHVYFVYTVYRRQMGTIEVVAIKTSQKGLKKGWTRATFILRDDYLEKIKALAYWERKKVKEVVDDLLGCYLKGKRIKPKG